MRWHAAHQTEEGSMCHPYDAEACKHFDRMYPDFVEEPHNVRLGLCIDSFAPHGQYGRLSLLYNLLLGIYMSSKYMFLTMVIPDPSSPKHPIDVYLELLIEELLQLWYVDVGTYGHTTDRAFIMRTVLMWTVNDLPVYGIEFGWITAGVMGCLVCIDDTRAFHLQHGRKECYFGCHRQFLPVHHSYRRNKKTFTKNCVENKVTRSRLTGDQILDRVTNISPAVEMPLSLPDGFSSDHKWTKKNIF
ncbi:UNVERIFIED_CONTAM: hypothetical protein Sradi_6425600 [Sesamum radiatum]|uniref:Uncharacterized protein n=1 Tax=Sesamum radiatum TaxID=300843 RepID=A0AAW2K528_SESRA